MVPDRPIALSQAELHAVTATHGRQQVVPTKPEWLLGFQD
jgi:hypothetical protein